MDDENNHVAGEPSSTAPVMDVAPRRSIPISDGLDDEAAVDPVPPTPTESFKSPEPVSPTQFEDTETLSNEDVSPVDIEDNSPLEAQVSAPGSLEVAEPPDEHPLSPNPLAIHASPEPIHHQTPVTAVLIALLIGLTLVGIITFAYLKTRDTNAKSGQAKTSQPATPVVPEVSSSDVDKTNQALDEEIKKADDSTDFNTNDLTNATLGL